MERLTIPDVLVDEHTTRRTMIDGEAVREHAMDFYWRLKAYEDTHMMPSDVTSMRMDMAIIAALFNGVDADRMKELAEADKDGRLVVLPCKVGDKLYRVFAGEIFEHRVGSMKYFAIQGHWDIETYPFCPCVESSIGETIFLTREEAERALEVMKDE